MEAYKVTFNVWANSQEEADALSQSLQRLVNDYGAKGIAISADRTTQTIEKWKNNFLINNQINKIYQT